MAAVSTIIAGVGLAVGAIGTAASIQQSRAARRDAQEAARRQREVAAEGAVSNARDNAMATRQRIREERVRRAQIIAASENTGTEASSVSMSALGGMATQFGAASGTSLGMFQQGQRLTALNQSIADFQTSANNRASRSGAYGQVASAGWGLFNFGFNQYQQNKAAKLKAAG